MDLKPADTASDILQNGILVATSKGLVCMTLTDALSSNLNLSVEDLKTVAEQLILQDQVNKRLAKGISYSFAPRQLSSDATVDSDDPTSDSSGTITGVLTQTSTETRSDSSLGNCIGAGMPSNNKLDKSETVTINESYTHIIDHHNYSVSDSDASSVIASTYSDGNMDNISHGTANTVLAEMTIETNKLPAKRRGGWPKGRKRKPELLHLPPKAPATGYNLYLNDMRKQFKDSTLAFHEITKIIGNRWSSLSLEQKNPYLERAEEDKRRYREELRVYRQSGAYQLYLAKKRRKRVQNNVLSESDMDATDDIDDEDNEELYCRTCDQWFHNLHNKREHLQGRQHVQAVVGDMRSELGSDYDTDCFVNTSSVSFSTSLDESSLEANPALLNASSCNGANVAESIVNLISVVTKREKEINTLRMRVEEAQAAHDALYQQLHSLREREVTLKDELESLRSIESNIESKVFQLWQVPSLFVTTDLNSSCLTSEYLTNE